MNERTTLEIIASTVEEALQQGLSQLGLTAEAVSVEVLDSGTKGLFGLGGRQVRVRLSVNPPPGEHKPSADSSSAVAGEQSKPPPRTDRKPAPAKKAESAPKEKEARPRRAEKKPVEEALVIAKKTERPGHDQLLDTTEEVVSRLIHHLGMEAQVSAGYDVSSTDDRRSIQVDVRGDDLSALIGRQAETLTAFQHIASLIVGKQTQQWVQLTVDVEGYRSRREKQIRQLANRLADQVTRMGRKVTMEPMTANERRMVHIELRGHPAVITESTGEEPYRKVVIFPKE
ncbi:MAG: RNA-binding cell elongation regulator Jag/EloR [Anaerolineales bacterium]|nr:RNA-binding cell elongation regulator Jag/EloR [Anaerolineales bacterium]